MGLRAFFAVPPACRSFVMSLKQGFLGLSALFLTGLGLPCLSGASSVQVAEKTYTEKKGQ
jgi:hypothetical protein